MTNEEAELYLKMYIKAYWKGTIVPPKPSVINMAIEALEKQRYIATKIEWLKTLNPYEMILVSDVLDWFEDAKVEDD